MQVRHNREFASKMVTDVMNAEPEDAAFVLSKTKGVHGFFGVSSMERLPVEVAITNTTKEFKAVQITK